MGKKRSHDQETEHNYSRKASRLATYSSQSLDLKYPQTTPLAQIPEYDSLRPLLPKKPLPTGPAIPHIKDRQLEEQVFTHSSTLDSKYSGSRGHSLDYERLEFLGDAYVQCIATRLIFSRFPKPVVGKQASLRESLVKNETLASFSYEYELPGRLNIGEKLRQSMSKQHLDKVAADVLEAYVAAVILSDTENGFADVENWLTQLWTPLLLESNVVAIETNMKDIINRRLQGKTVKIIYREEKPVEIKDGGKQSHTIGLYLTGWGYENELLGKGIGCGKTEAGMLAAFDALENNSELLAKIEESKRVQEEVRKAKQMITSRVGESAAMHSRTG